MEYKGYNLQFSDYGVIIRDIEGKYLLEVSTEEEAIEYIDEGLIDDYPNHNLFTTTISKKQSLYDVFDKYCKKLYGKRYFEDRTFGTFDENSLKKFIKSFTKDRNIKVIYEAKYMGGEYYYIVTDVYEE